jgi:GNAT superfamily N-acetyltransferase
LRRTAGVRDLRHHLERWELQQRSEGSYLLAWSNQDVVGRCTVYFTSKYESVRGELGMFPEVNALEARIQSVGIGSALLAAAEDVALGDGRTRIGLACEEENTAALRLYKRLGYERWPGRAVIDLWEERDEAGNLRKQHADECLYLTKELAAGR